MGKSNRSMDYDIIFDLYELEKMDSYEKRKIRQQLRYCLGNYLKKMNKPDTTTWYDLSKEEQDHFICYEIKDMLKKRHSDPIINSRIDRNLKQHSLNTLTEAKELLEERNDSVTDIWKTYCKASDSTEKKRKAYEELCLNMRAYNKIIPVPSFERFSRNPRRAYDYIQDFYDSRMDITPVIIRIILQVLKQRFDLEIDYYSIMECLRSLDSCQKKLESLGFDFEEFESLPTEYDENMAASKEEFDALRMEMGKYQKYEKMLRDLTPFYKIDRFKK